MKCLGKGREAWGRGKGEIRRGRIDTLNKHEIHESDLAKRFDMHHLDPYYLYQLTNFYRIFIIYLSSTQPKEKLIISKGANMRSLNFFFGTF